MGAFLAHNNPVDAGIFRRGRMIYFSPKAAEICSPSLPELPLVECAAPTEDEVESISVADWNAIPFADR